MANGLFESLPLTAIYILVALTLLDQERGEVFRELLREYVSVRLGAASGEVQKDTALSRLQAIHELLWDQAVAEALLNPNANRRKRASNRVHK